MDKSNLYRTYTPRWLIQPSNFLALLQLCDPTQAANARILELQSQVGGLSGEDNRPQAAGT